jgi:hypothetical protein
MDNTILLTLYKPQIIESVKNETYKSGRFEKAADAKAISVAYEIQAGNEDYQERLLERSFSTGLEELKTNLSDYLQDSGYSTGDNIFSADDNSNITITLVVGNRFNKSYTDSLAKLCAKYVEEVMLMDWWKPVNEKKSSLYAQFVERDLKAIKRCFNKTAPEAPSYKYPTTLSVVGSAINIGVGEERTVTYSISDGAIDDINIRVQDPNVCSIGSSSEGVTIIGKNFGETYIQLYSRHNEELSKTIHVYVAQYE